MAPLPFIGRLHPYEYFALGLSFLLAFFELIIRTITLLLPTPIIRFCYRISRNAFNSLSSPYSRRARNKKKSVSSPIAQASDFVELCELYGYYAEEHVVQTKDGYLLGVHRLGWRKGEEDVRVNTGEGSVQKKVVYLHHGLLMNSEVWVCITEKERCLPFLLVDQGYDVWLGNNRGNKYSKKCMRHSPAEVEFWNFSMDQFAFHDIPDSINYILSTTGQQSLSYIGFSQGTAQAFATLSIHPTLNNKVDVFVALAPAMAPPGLASGIVSSLVKTNPEILFLLFGRRAILGSTTMWSALLYPAIFAWFIDKSLLFLFNWRSRNITPHQKLAAYPHLYSFTSTKSVVHWFQIIRNGTFQMYDDEVSTPLSLSQGSKYYKVAKFPTRNIRTPIVLVYGGSDSLVDVNVMLKELPRHTVAKCIPKYEHLDLLWASDVDRLVFPHVLEALEWYAMPEATKPGLRGLPGSWRNGNGVARLMESPFNGSQPPGYSEDEGLRSFASGEDEGSVIVATARAIGSRGTDGTAVEDTEQMDESDYEEEPGDLALTPQPPLETRETRSQSRIVDGAMNPVQPTLLPRATDTDVLQPHSFQSRPQPAIRSISSNTATSQSTVVPRKRSPNETASHRRVVSPTNRVQRERNRRSRVSEDSEGQVTVLPESRVGRERAPEGWWSSTDTSSREFETNDRYILDSVDAT